MSLLLLLLLQARLRYGKKRYGCLGPSVVRVSKNRIIKGPCETVELEAMKYIAQHTSIPVPRVLHVYYYSDKGRGRGRMYIEMEYIHGQTLQDLWRTMSAEGKQSIVKQIAGYIDQLRCLEPPAASPRCKAVASADYGPCLDYRVGPDKFGPFATIQDFHSFLRGGILLADCTTVFGESVTMCHTRQYRTFFSHGDICARNLIVREGKIAAVIDWQFSGWYPEYWDYTKAHFGLLNMDDWYEGFRQAVSRRYDDELAAETALWARLDQPGMVFVKYV